VVLDLRVIIEFGCVGRSRQTKNSLFVKGPPTNRVPHQAVSAVAEGRTSQRLDIYSFGKLL
jgi:hypothetical protein